MCHYDKVLPPRWMSLSMAACTRASDSVSNALVASSKQNLWTLEKGARERDSLLLTPAQPRSALTNLCLKSLFLLHDEIVCIGLSCSLFNFGNYILLIRLAVDYVFFNSAVEERRVLLDAAKT